MSDVNFGAMSVQVIYKSDSAKGPLEWRNNHEIEAPAGGLAVDFQLVANAFADAFLPLLCPEFSIDRVVIGTLAEDGQPYNPETFAVLPVNLRGIRNDPLSAASSTLPITNILHVQKLTSRGRLGRMFLRGMLMERDVESDVNGGNFLTNPEGIQAELDTAWDTIQTGLGGAANMALISGSGLVLNSRNVTGFKVKGVSSKSVRNNRKSFATREAASNLRSVLADGGVTIEELPTVIQGVNTLLKVIGETGIPLLPS